MKRYYLIAYLLVAIVVYGHAWTTFEKRIPPGDRSIGAVVCAALWPLYVSVEVWR